LGILERSRLTNNQVGLMSANNQGFVATWLANDIGDINVGRNIVWGFLKGRDIDVA
jgi:hypothetical protein